MRNLLLILSLASLVTTSFADIANLNCRNGPSPLDGQVYIQTNLNQNSIKFTNVSHDNFCNNVEINNNGFAVAQIYDTDADAEISVAGPFNNACTVTLNDDGDFVQPKVTYSCTNPAIKVNLSGPAELYSPVNNPNVTPYYSYFYTLTINFPNPPTNSNTQLKN